MQVRLISSLVRLQLKNHTRPRPMAQTACPSPPPARASCHVAQRRGARLCGARPWGGPEPEGASLPPPPARVWTEHA